MIVEAVKEVAPAACAQGFARVGPVGFGGYPAWYQDKTGLGMEFCSPLNDSELGGGWCLLLAGDTVAPEVFPGQFFDEHFYWAASVDASNGGTKALLVLALEGAFAVPGRESARAASDNGRCANLASGRRAETPLMKSVLSAVRSMADKSRLDESAALLAQIAELLTSNEELKLERQGHTDNVGATPANLTLSQGRAAAVKDDLVKTHQIAAARLTTAGFGDSKPVGDNATDEGKTLNRRVELVKKS